MEYGVWPGMVQRSVIWVFLTHKSLEKKTGKLMQYLRLAIQGPIFPVSDTEFEGVGDGRGCGDCILGSNMANPAMFIMPVLASGNNASVGQ
jgi:hypothetical protein